MKIVDKICEIFGLYGEDAEEEILDETLPNSDNKVLPMFGQHKESSRESKASARNRSFFTATKQDDKLISMPIPNKQVKVIVIEPVNFDDAQKVADYLRKNQPVVINFEDTDSVVMKRIVDFVSGTIYALNGTLKKIGRSIIVAAPQNVDIDAASTSAGERGGNPWLK